ncbi:hypothetical protein [Gordonia shandongensis]|uniref:hypothetical protein n=1 Tax=Gordonia shandongensis TaxID=376351 RepID=UPI0004212BD2|nr:hypothetical protein [Gordonia shandongensis]
MTLSDAQAVQILDRTVAAVDPMIDVLATADPLNLKPRTFAATGPGSCLDRTADAASQVLDVLDWPGTAGWDELAMKDRADWWVSRIGTVTTSGAAFPGVFGAWTKKLPVGDYLAFANQALVLRAVAREYGLISRDAGIAMLGAILFDRDLRETTAASVAVDSPLPSDPDTRRRSFIGRLWTIGRDLHDLSNSIGHRPGPPRLLSAMTWLPLVGGPATYFGEYLALRRAARACRKWIVAHPEWIVPSAAPYLEESPHRS